MKLHGSTEPGEIARNIHSPIFIVDFGVELGVRSYWINKKWLHDLSPLMWARSICSELLSFPQTQPSFSWDDCRGLSAEPITCCSKVGQRHFCWRIWCLWAWPSCLCSVLGKTQNVGFLHWSAEHCIQFYCCSLCLKLLQTLSVRLTHMKSFSIKKYFLILIVNLLFLSSSL